MDSLGTRRPRASELVYPPVIVDEKTETQGREGMRSGPVLPHRALTYRNYAVTRKPAPAPEIQNFRKSHTGICFLLISLGDRQSGSNDQLCLQH